MAGWSQEVSGSRQKGDACFGDLARCRNRREWRRWSRGAGCRAGLRGNCGAKMVGDDQIRVMKELKLNPIFLFLLTSSSTAHHPSDRNIQAGVPGGQIVQNRYHAVGDRAAEIQKNHHQGLVTGLAHLVSLGALDISHLDRLDLLVQFPFLTKVIPGIRCRRG